MQQRESGMLHEMSENGWFASSNGFLKFVFLPKQLRDSSGLSEFPRTHVVKSGSLSIAALNVAASICE